jgi:signal transduction histidine kinase
MIVAKNKFILKVIDNGKGFDGTIKGSGNGWKNMHKRTDYLNGKLTIDSEPGKGTKIIVSIPYPLKYQVHGI